MYNDIWVFNLLWTLYFYENIFKILEVLFLFFEYTFLHISLQRHYLCKVFSYVKVSFSNKNLISIKILFLRRNRHLIPSKIIWFKSFIYYKIYTNTISWNLWQLKNFIINTIFLMFLIYVFKVTNKFYNCVGEIFYLF